MDNRENGWIEWSGGECPVDPAASVEIMYREERDNPALYVEAVLPARDCEWGHDKRHPKLDIVCYRRAKALPTKQGVL